MSVTYERTGGFAGIRQRLEISTDAVKLQDRRLGTRERALAGQESKRLEELVKKAKPVPFPAQGASGIRDGFNLKLWLDGEAEPRVAMTVTAMPLSGSDGTPWGDLLAYVDELLTAELDAAKAGPKK